MSKNTPPPPPPVAVRFDQPNIRGAGWFRATSLVSAAKLPKSGMPTPRVSIEVEWQNHGDHPLTADEVAFQAASEQALMAFTQMVGAAFTTLRKASCAGGQDDGGGETPGAALARTLAWLRAGLQEAAVVIAGSASQEMRTVLGDPADRPLWEPANLVRRFLGG